VPSLPPTDARTYLRPISQIKPPITQSEEERALTHLVHVPQVLEPPLWINDGEVDIHIPIRLLHLLDFVDDHLNGGLEFRGVGGGGAVGRGQEVADAFDPASERKRGRRWTEGERRRGRRRGGEGGRREEEGVVGEEGGAPGNVAEAREKECMLVLAWW